MTHPWDSTTVRGISQTKEKTKSIQWNCENQTQPLALHLHLHSAHSTSLFSLCVCLNVRVLVCVLPGVSPASHSHPHSQLVRDRAAAARSSRGLLLPSSCGREESTPYCLYSQVMHPSLTVSGGKRRRLGGITHKKKHFIQWSNHHGSPQSLLHVSAHTKEASTYGYIITAIYTMSVLSQERKKTSTDLRRVINQLGILINSIQYLSSSRHYSKKSITFFLTFYTNNISLCTVYRKTESTSNVRELQILSIQFHLFFDKMQ